MCYQARKHTKTDPLNAILDHIQKNPHSYSNKAMYNKKDDNQNTHDEHGVTNNSQGSRQEQIEEKSDNTRVDNDNISEGENIVKTRYRRIVRKPDRLMYQQGHMNACLANMLGAVNCHMFTALIRTKQTLFHVTFA